MKEEDAQRFWFENLFSQNNALTNDVAINMFQERFP